MSKDTNRDAFEAWAKTNHLDITQYQDAWGRYTYNASHIDAMWFGWQAATEQSKRQPPYPEGDVVGPCVCGSWPGGKCLKCPWTPATSAKPASVQGEPVAYVVAIPDKPITMTVPVAKLDLLAASHNAPLYLHAAIAQPEQPKGDAKDAEIAMLRNQLTGDNGALTRMDRARGRLTKDNPTPLCNWGVLDTSDIRAAIANKKATQ